MTRCTLSPQVRASHSTQISSGPKEQQGSGTLEKRTPTTCSVPHVRFFSVWVRGRHSSLRDSNYSEIKSCNNGSSLPKPLRRKGDLWQSCTLGNIQGQVRGTDLFPLDPGSHTLRPGLRTAKKKTAVPPQTHTACLPAFLKGGDSRWPNSCRI